MSRQVLHPKGRVVRSVRAKGVADDFANAPGVNRPPFRSPPIHRPRRMVEEATTRGADPRSIIAQTQSLLDTESYLSFASAKELLSEVDLLLRIKHFLALADILSIAGVVGTLLIKSPLKSSDPTLLPLFHKLANQIEKQIDNFETSELCLCIWFFGCLGPIISRFPDFGRIRNTVDLVMSKIEERGVESIKDAVRLFWGIERMKIQGHSNLTRQTTQRIIFNVHHCPNEELSDLATIVLVASKLRVHEGVEFLRKVGHVVKHRFPDFTDEALRDFVTGFAIFDYQKHRFVFGLFCAELENRLMTMKLPILIQILLNLSKIRYLPNESLLVGFQQRVMAFEGYLNPSLVTYCIQALSQFNAHYPKLQSRLMGYLLASPEDYSIAQICIALISCARLDDLSEERLMAGLKSLSDQLHAGIDKNSQLFLHQVLTHARLMLDKEISDDLIPANWQLTFQQEWMKGQVARVSKKLSSLELTASALGLEVHQELTPQSKLLVQYVQFGDDDQKVVLDLICSRVHCFFNKTQAMLPWKIWQKRVLQREGYQVLSIYEEEWNRVPMHLKAKYLSKKLQLEPQNTVISQVLEKPQKTVSEVLEGQDMS